MEQSRPKESFAGQCGVCAVLCRGFSMSAFEGVGRLHCLFVCALHARAATATASPPVAVTATHNKRPAAALHVIGHHSSPAAIVLFCRRRARALRRSPPLPVCEVALLVLAVVGVEREMIVATAGLQVIESASALMYTVP